MKRFAPGIFALLCAAPMSLLAVEPTATEQTAMQAALSQYLRGFNACDREAMLSATVRPVNVFSRGLSPVFQRRATGQSDACAADSPRFEVSALARMLHVVTPEVAIADGYFRTMDLPGKDRSGSLQATFLKQEGKWKVMALRFYVAPSDRPYVEVQPSAKHDEGGPDGWVSLFDGKSGAAFQEVGGDPFPASWKVENGILEAVPVTARGMTSHALRTRDTYKSFELDFEWKVRERGNSGIKYHLFFLSSGTTGSDATGHEYQLADDDGDPGAKQFPVERSGSLYNQIAAQGAKPKPLGEFNQSRIVVRGRHREHWLNGVKVLEYESESNPPEGPIVIQHHQTGAAFRSMKIRRID